MSASLNGDNVQVLAENDLDEPTGLTIDFYKNNRIFWCDQKNDFIESMNSDGSDRVRIHHAGLSKPYKLDVFENHVYFMSKELGSVNKVDKFGRGGLISLVANLDLIDDVKVFHSLKTPKISKHSVQQIIY